MSPPSTDTESQSEIMSPPPTHTETQSGRFMLSCYQEIKSPPYERCSIPSCDTGESCCYNCCFFATSILTNQKFVNYSTCFFSDFCKAINVRKRHIFLTHNRFHFVGPWLINVLYALLKVENVFKWNLVKVMKTCRDIAGSTPIIIRRYAREKSDS